MIRCIHAGLDGKHSLRVADVAAQVFGHPLQRLENPGEYFGVGLNDGVLRVAYVEVDRAIVGIDHRFDRIADVIAQAGDRLGVRVTVGCGVPVQKPEQAAFLGNHQVGIWVQADERGDPGDPVVDFSVVHDPAFSDHVVGEKDVDRPEADGEDDLPPEG